MQALWLTSGYPWPGNPVGFVFHRTQALACAAVGVSIRVAAATPWVPPGLTKCRPHWAAYRAAPHRQSDGDVEILRPRYPTTPRENQLGIAHWLQAGSIAGLSRPDLIHAHFAYPCGAAGLLLKRLWKVPLVLTLHGDDVTIYPHHNKRMRTLFRHTVLGADRVIAVSPALAAQTQEMTGRLPEILSTGIDLQTFQPRSDRLAVRARLGITADAFVVLFVGALLPQKGVLDLAEALRLCDIPNVVEVFVGNGPVRPETPHALLLGARANEEIPDMLSAADVFVLPSWHEGLGQAAVEAGAMGVPLVAAATGGLADLADDDRGLLFTPRDVAALRSALERVYRDPASARVRAARLQALVRDEHDLHRNAGRLAAIYQSATQQSSRK